MFGSGVLALIDNGGNMPEGAAAFAASRGALQVKRPAPIPNQRTSDRLQCPGWQELQFVLSLTTFAIGLERWKQWANTS